jgi:hypothetical protein
MTRLSILIVAVLIAFIALPVNAEEVTRGNFGVGVMLGTPSGLDAKLFLSETRALEFGLGWSLQGNNDLLIQADYLVHRYERVQLQTGKLPFYAGLGVVMRFIDNSDNLFGIRIPLGIAYEFGDVPFDVFATITPLLVITPDSDFDLDAVIGGRFYF